MKKDLTLGGELPLERYRAAMEEFPLATVDIIFLNPERTQTLLGRRTKEPYAGQFYSFGGRLYKNEEFLDAACRIAKQEAGVSITASALTFGGVLNEISDNSRFDGVNYHAVDVYFGCIIKKQAIVLDDQHSEQHWLDVNDSDVHSNVRARIASVLRAL